MPMMRCDKELDLEKMISASKYLLGKHNFKAFATRDDNVKNFDRELKEIKIVQKDNVFSFELTGNGFLYNMVRIIVGSLLDVGTSKKEPISIKQILDSKDRTNAGRLADSKGLCLINVCY